MNPYQTLKAEAKRKRDLAIQAARAEYREALRAIDKLGQKLDAVGAKNRYTASVWGGEDFTRTTAAKAAEIVLRDMGPLTTPELVLECQRRGFRSNEHPKKVACAIRAGMKYHRERFSKTGDRWSIAGKASRG